MGLIENWKKKKEWERVNAERAAKEEANKQLMAEAEAEAPRYLDHRVVKIAGDQAIILCKLYCLGKDEHGEIHAVIGKDAYSIPITSHEHPGEICIIAKSNGIFYGYNTDDHECGGSFPDYVSEIDGVFHSRTDSRSNERVKEEINVGFVSNGMEPADEKTQKTLLFAIRNYCKMHYLDGLSGYTFETELKDHLMIKIRKKEGPAPKLEAW